MLSAVLFPPAAAEQTSEQSCSPPREGKPFAVFIEGPGGTATLGAAARNSSARAVMSCSSVTGQRGPGLCIISQQGAAV